jgi:uncharacterized protein (TIGR00369 family)
MEHMEQDQTMPAAQTPSDPDFEARIRASFARQHFMGFIGAELVAVRPGYCEIHLPYSDDLTLQHGFCPAGVDGTLAYNASGYAGYTLMAADASVLTVEYKLNLLAPGAGERLIARGQVIKPGRTLTICRSDVFAVKQGVESLCATALVTLMQLPGKPDTPA